MTRHDFNKLDLDERYDAILEWGFFMGKKTTEANNKVLYAFHGYFAEMDIRRADNKVMEARAFDKIDKSIEKFYLIDKENPFVKLLGASE